LRGLKNAVIGLNQRDPYAPPRADDDGPSQLVDGVASWDGVRLLVPKRFRFPELCLKCGSTEIRSRRTQKFAFAPAWTSALFFLCLPAAALALLLTTQRATLELPLCDACHARWRRARVFGVLLGLGALLAIFGAAVLGFKLRSELPVIGAMLLLLVGLAVGMQKLVRPYLLQAKPIDQLSVTLLGVDPPTGAKVAGLSQP